MFKNSVWDRSWKLQFPSTFVVPAVVSKLINKGLHAVQGPLSHDLTYSLFVAGKFPRVT